MAGLGVGGVAVALAARDTISNIISGVILMTDRPFKRGDLIETEAGWASVEVVGLRSTKLRTLSDALLVIPNSLVTDKTIINWGKRRSRRTKMMIGLTYDTPREKLDAFVVGLKEIYARQPRADKTKCTVGLKSFGPSSIDIEFIGHFVVYGYDAEVAAQHAFMGDIIDLARDHGVSFAFPTRTVHVVNEGLDDAPAASMAPGDAGGDLGAEPEKA